LKINWRVRFSRHNLAFIVRFVGALLIPVLAYLGIQFEDLNSWPALWDLLVKFLSNPFLIGLAIVNAINMIPDPTTKGFSDSQRAMTYKKPAK